MSRKTFDVEEFKNKINYLLKNGTVSPLVRIGYITTLEDILHATGNYRGFRYLTRRELDVGVVPGIETELDGSFIKDDYERQFKDTDSTRVQYL